VRSGAGAARRVVAVVAVAAALLGEERAHADGGGETTFRFARAVDVAPRAGTREKGTWARVELPGDVLDAARPGLPDVRLLDGRGAEIPYAFESTVAAAGVPPLVPLIDVEAVAKGETTAMIDRGAHPPLADAVAIDIVGDDFLKPVAIEASDDRATWREIARGSIFATARVRMTTLRFAPSDRRWWRFRFDDRLGPPVAPRGVRLHPQAASSATREIVAAVERVSGHDGKSVYALTLPGKNLLVSRLRVSASDAAYARDVTVIERVVYRGEVSRRVLGAGTLLRGADGAPRSDLALGDVAGRALELEVDDGGSAPLAITEARLDVEPRAIVFFAAGADPASLRLVYGATRVDAPRYDLGAALAFGRPASLVAATLGPAVDHGEPPATPPARGAVLDPLAWRDHRPIVLPPGDRGGVAYLSLDGIAPGTSGDVRIVDAAFHQVPYVVEAGATRTRRDVERAVAEKGSRTVLTLTDLGEPSAIDAVVLTATGPDYFSRSVSVVEAMRDARGVTGERFLGAGTWEKKPGVAAAPLTVSIASPSRPELEVRIENGDNAPITVGPALVERAVRRVDFEFAAGDRLELLAGNAAADAPSYDLSMLEGALLAAPAEAATLGVAATAPPPPARVPGWFWGAVIAAGLIVGAALARGMAKKPA
jgi:hypothetical protein